jgi:hypothetical protein
MDRIEELRRLEGAATPEEATMIETNPTTSHPWDAACDREPRCREHWIEDDDWLDATVVMGGSPEGDITYGAKNPIDAAFIAAARNALPKLLDVVEAARATGWNEADGRCWCPESRETTGKPEHEPRCARLRAALAALDSQS